MLRLSANLSTLFRELPMLERFEAAARAGFAAVELQYPYVEEVGDLAAAARKAGLPVVLINAWKGSRPEDRGLACLPGREAEFRETIEQGLDASALLGNSLIHVLSGVPVQGASRAECFSVWSSNMRWAAARASDRGVEIVIEALNQTDVPSYFIASLDDAAALIEEAGLPEVGLLFDVYHCAMAGEPVVARFQTLRSLIRHIQIADAPGRAEPGTGRIDWSEIFAAIEEAAWGGCVGVEYIPQQDTLAGLGWARPYLKT